MLKRSEIERQILAAQKEAANLFRGNPQQTFEADLARWRTTGEHPELVEGIDAGAVVVVHSTSPVKDWGGPYFLVHLSEDDLAL